MSAPGRRFTCTNCDFEAVHWVMRFPHVYRLPDGAKINAPWGYGWCNDCQTITGIQKGLSPVALQKKCDKLRAAVPPERRSSWFPWLGNSKNTKTRTQMKLEENEQLLSILAGYPSLPKCIDCGSTAVEESLPHAHPGCGGQFVSSETEIRLQLNSPEKILVPAFG